MDVSDYRGHEGERGTASSVAQAEQPGVLENGSTGVLTRAVYFVRHSEPVSAILFAM